MTEKNPPVEAGPGIISYYTKVEVYFAKQIAAALLCEDAGCFMQGDPIRGEIAIDGKFDLRNVARRLINSLGENNHPA
ncbi:hypothetical protein [Methylobacterium sp. SD21]|uniref:hypothetical protein n=1 Tax=Methylobacterium litchii TaxID=3138810 RepID=UPI00313DFAF7